MNVTMLTHRLATTADEPALRALMTLAIDRLQNAYLSPDQVAASHAFMGMDSRLIGDGTYFVIHREGQLAGCGGWSKRATPYGHDGSDTRDERFLDPATDAARVRAMYTHPDHVRHGVARLILTLCEAAARAQGFGALQLSSTLSGAPLYHACGFVDVARFHDRGVPLILMNKQLVR